MISIPKDFPVQPLKPGEPAADRVTCGTCGLSWDDAIPTTYTPAPAARCPFEYFHDTPDPEAEEKRRGELLARVLRLKPVRGKPDRYGTEWGDKTALGLYRTVARIISGD